MRNHTGRRLTVAVASILLVAACAERGGRVTIQSTTTTAATTTTTAAPVEEPITTTTQAPADAEGEDAAPAETVAPPTGDVVEYGPAAEDLIAVVDTEGSVFLLERDGDRRIQLHDGADGVTADYPTWAPSGERIAYVLGPQSPDSAVVTTNIDGSGRVEVDFPFAAYYLAWDPTSRLIAGLGNDATGQRTALAIGSADRSNTATQQDTGEPTYYFTWMGERGTVAAHARNEVREVTPGLSITRYGNGNGLYNPPLTTGRPDELLVASGQPTLGVLQRINVESLTVENLASFRGSARMTVTDDGSRVAVFISGTTNEPAPNDPVPPDDIPFLDRGLWVVDLDTGDAELVISDGIAGMFWSPDGDRLLIAGITEIGSELFLQWQVLDDESLVVHDDLYRPSTLYVRMLQFFDQYALSGSPWSPDGSSFTFSAASADGREGVWVESVEGDSASLIYEGGAMAFWSPT